jgi:hypothetical protein
MGAARLQRTERDEAAARGVKHRHRIDPYVAFARAACFCIETRVIHEPAVMQHRAFWKTGGAGRVLDLRDVVGPDVRQRDRCGFFVACIRQVVERGDLT